MSESAVTNDASNQPLHWPNITVDLKECYKVWRDDCKSTLLDAICNELRYAQDICCDLIASETISGDCYFAIADDLRKHYPCKTSDLAPSLATDNWQSCLP
ncbi:hypothetical protein AAHA92_19395 [Salvia divinorum]